MEQARLDKLKASLDEVHGWPSVYMFKFVITTEIQKEKQLLKIFTEDIEVSKRLSKNGKYTSLTIKEVLFSADDVIARYKAAYQIEGVIAL